MSNWKARLGNIQTATHKKVFANALRRNGNNYAPLKSFSTPTLNSNYPLKRLNALTPSNIKKPKKIGQSSKQPGERSNLNTIIHGIGGKRKTYKCKTRKHHVRKH